MNSLAVITSVTLSPVVAVFVVTVHGSPVLATGRSTVGEIAAMLLLPRLLDTIRTTSSSGAVVSTSTCVWSVTSASVSTTPALFAASEYEIENVTAPSASLDTTVYDTTHVRLSGADVAPQWLFVYVIESGIGSPMLLFVKVSSDVMLTPAFAAATLPESSMVWLPQSVLMYATVPATELPPDRNVTTGS